MQDAKRFAVELVQQAHQWAEAYVGAVYEGIREPMYGESLLRWLEGHMWREWALGCLPPAKIIGLLRDEDWDLKQHMSLQIADEWRHSRIFSERIESLGGDGELDHYEPTEEDLHVFHSTYDHDHPALIATALHCAGEVALQTRYKVMTDPGNPLIEGETARLVREKILDEKDYHSGSVVDDTTALRVREEVIPDEGPHIRFGRLILERYAVSQEIQDKCRKVLENKLAAIDAMNRREVANTLGGGASEVPP